MNCCPCLIFTCNELMFSPCPEPGCTFFMELVLAKMEAEVFKPVDALSLSVSSPNLPT